MSWAEERRADRNAAAEQARQDAAAASARRIRETAALAEQRRTEADAVADRRRAQEAADRATREATRDKARDGREAKRDKARGRRKKALAGACRWGREHVVDLLIYPLAVASAVMAIPSMAAYGISAFGGTTGIVLPVLSELGMWSFAVAVMVSRRRHPDRPVWMLQTGVWVFAAVALGLNVMHGLAQGSVDAAVVMGVASIAGVIAHQLITAGARRTRAERIDATLARTAVRKTARARRAAIRTAVAEIDSHGNVDLVFASGRYLVGRRGRLTRAVVPGLPVDPAPAVADTVADEAAAWLANQDRPTDSDSDSDTGSGGSPIGIIDRDPEQQKSTPNPGRHSGRVTRSIEDLRTELAAKLAADPGSIDLTSAESIRKALRCKPERARLLRDEHRNH